jgi:hypothetical protein
MLNEEIVDSVVVAKAKVDVMAQAEKERYAHKIINRLVTLKEKGAEDVSQEELGWCLKSLYDSIFSLALENENVLGICNEPNNDALWKWRLDGFRYTPSPDFRFKPQYKRKIFEQVLATWLDSKCLTAERLSREEKEKVIQLASEAPLGSFYAIKELLCSDIHHLQKNKTAQQVSIKEMLARAERMAELHGSVGWLFRALVFVHLLHNYGKISKEQKNQLTELGFNKPSDCLDFMITSFYMAWLLESYSQAAINNAYFGLNIFTVLQKDISDIIVVKDPPETTSVKDTIDALGIWFSLFNNEAIINNKALKNLIFIKRCLPLPARFAVESFKEGAETLAKPIITEIEGGLKNQNGNGPVSL